MSCYGVCLAHPLHVKCSIRRRPFLRAVLIALILVGTAFATRPAQTWSPNQTPRPLPLHSEVDQPAFDGHDNQLAKVGAVLTTIRQVPESSAMLLLAVGLFFTARLSRRRDRKPRVGIEAERATLLAVSSNS